MAYRLAITERAAELIDKLVSHLLYEIKSEQATIHLLNEIQKIYDRLEENPMQFPICRNIYLASKGYREAVVSEMSYIIIYKILENQVIIMGVFHQLENYQEKIS